MARKDYLTSPVDSDAAVKVSGTMEASVLVGDWPASQNSGCVVVLWAKCAAGTDAENPHASTESCTAGYCGRSPSIGRSHENRLSRRFYDWI